MPDKSLSLAPTNKDHQRSPELDPIRYKSWQIVERGVIPNP
jgi:hypothetical protein